MQSKLRQKWDSVNDRPDFRPPSRADEFAAWNRAVSKPIAKYRAKLVKLPHGQTELSVTPTNETSVINARMGFNPLLDCARKRRTPEEQEQRDIENRKRAAKRARQNVRWLNKCIQADHLLTFSYRENVIDRLRVSSDWQELVRLYRVRYPDWRYVAVLEKQERGAYHIHVAVHGKHDMRWLLRCWLLAIGQSSDDVSAWLVGGVKLAEKSLRAVNVQAPNRRWGGTSKSWKVDKLAGYLTKYIGKEFDSAEKSAKKYWHSKNIDKPEIIRYWMKADNWLNAVLEARDTLVWQGADSLSFWGNEQDNVVWVVGSTYRENLGKVTQCEPDWDLLQ
jgi:hypothetical protein